MRGPAWQHEGDDPDYRFTLANERTFLAWIRTALALLAGGVLLHQFASTLEPRVVLAIAGAGDLEDELKQRATASGVADRVRFLGNLAQDEVATHLAGADIVVVPSVRDDSGNVDGLPNVVMEALASGTPLVATPAGGIASVLHDGENGLIVPERDPDAVACAIARLAADGALRDRLGAAARAMVAARHGWSATAERFEAAYDRALAIKSAGR